MGLDMYLNRMPRYKGVTAKQISAIECLFDYEKRSDEYRDCTFMEWCGYNGSDLPSKKTIEHFRQLNVFKYASWDEEKKFGYSSIMDQVGYWRKANAIHDWFVNHVQDGIDDCSYHNEVTEEILVELRNTCQAVIDSSEMTTGKIYVGMTYKDGQTYKEYRDGMVMLDQSVAEELLPTTDGFFFGGTAYDEYYIEDLKNTIEIIDKVLTETDFETQMIYYVSSW